MRRAHGARRGLRAGASAARGPRRAALLRSPPAGPSHSLPRSPLTRLPARPCPPQVIIHRLGDSQDTKAAVLQHADNIMSVLLQIFSLNSASVHEEAMMAVRSPRHATPGRPACQAAWLPAFCACLPKPGLAWPCRRGSRGRAERVPAPSRAGGRLHVRVRQAVQQVPAALLPAPHQGPAHAPGVAELPGRGGWARPGWRAHPAAPAMQQQRRCQHGPCSAASAASARARAHPPRSPAACPLCARAPAPAGGRAHRPVQDGGGGHRAHLRRDDERAGAEPER